MGGRQLLEDWYKSDSWENGRLGEGGTDKDPEGKVDDLKGKNNHRWGHQRKHNCELR